MCPANDSAASRSIHGVDASTTSPTPPAQQHSRTVTGCRNHASPYTPTSDHCGDADGGVVEPDVGDDAHLGAILANGGSGRGS